MNSVEPAEYRDVFETIRQWPPACARDLLRDVTRTLDDAPGPPDGAGTPPPR